MNSYFSKFSFLHALFQPTVVKPLLKEEPKKILIVKLGAVGDLVIASSFFDNLKKRFPNSEKVLLTGKTCFPSIQNNASIDRFLIADDAFLYVGNVFQKTKEFVRLVRLFKKEKFDMVFVMHRAWQFNFLVFSAGIPHRVGFTRGKDRFMLHHAVPANTGKNERETYLDLLRVLGVSANYQRTFFYLSEEEKGFPNHFFAQHRIRDDELVIAVAPGGGANVKKSMYSRRWPVEYFVNLIRRLQESRPVKIIIVGGPDDQPVVSKIMSLCSDCIDASTLSFGKMASLFQRCQLFIGNDSGPLHIASAMKLPSVSLYGPTDPKQWASPDPENTVVFKDEMECVPCYDDGNFPECDHISCLRAIEVQEVLLKALLKLPSVSETIKIPTTVA